MIDPATVKYQKLHSLQPMSLLQQLEAKPLSGIEVASVPVAPVAPAAVAAAGASTTSETAETSAGMNT